MRMETTAGFARASLYDYFQDEEDLVRLIYTRLVEPFFQSLEKIANASLRRAAKT